MKIYLVIRKEWYFNDEYVDHHEPGWLGQENSGQVFLDQAEAAAVARARNHAELRGTWLNVEDLTCAQGLGWWGYTEEDDWRVRKKTEWLSRPWFENPQFDPLHPVLARWNTSLKDFDWNIPADAAAEDLDVLIQVFDLERWMVLEAEIAEEDLTPEIQHYLEQHQGEAGAFSTPQDRRAVKTINDWFFKEPVCCADGTSRDSYYTEDWVEGSDSQEDDSGKD